MIAELERHPVAESNRGRVENIVLLRRHQVQSSGILPLDDIDAVVVSVHVTGNLPEDLVQLLVADYRAYAREPMISEDMVNVRFGVDQVTDRPSLQGKFFHLQQGRNPLRGVDEHRAFFRKHDARIAPADLGRRKYVLRNLFQCGCGRYCHKRTLLFRLFTGARKSVGNAASRQWTMGSPGIGTRKLGMRFSFSAPR